VLRNSCEGATNSKGNQDKYEGSTQEITRRRKPNKKGMHEKTSVDGEFLANQALKKEV
jgi:hypothetical protein